MSKPKTKPSGPERFAHLRGVDFSSVQAILAADPDDDTSERYVPVSAARGREDRALKPLVGVTFPVSKPPDPKSEAAAKLIVAAYQKARRLQGR